jgi:hypothetical protein
LPLFNREYADYTSSVHDPEQWPPLVSALARKQPQDYELR